MKKAKDISLSEKITKLHVERHTMLTKLNKKIDKLENELKEICTHSETKTRDLNYEGGYDHVAEYNKITECKTCGKELNRKTTYGGYA